MTSEQSWQWIYFLIWFKLACGSSSHMRLYSKSWTLSLYTKCLMKKTENMPKKQRHRWRGKKERPESDLKQPEKGGFATVIPREVREVLTKQLHRSAHLALEDWLASQVSCWALGVLPNWYRSFHKVCYLQDRWCLNRTANTLNKINYKASSWTKNFWKEF